MDTFTDNNKLISINKSVKNNENVIPSLIALHALSGCDTVPMMFGIGKAKALKATRKVPLQHIGDLNAEIEDVIREGSIFVAKCYGQNNVSSSENRRTIWMNKTDGVKKSSKPPALRSLPPTDEALHENIKRAHYVAIMWENCVSGCPPELDPCDYGWERDNVDQSLRPKMLPTDVDVAPEEVLQMTRCKCVSSQCKTNRCSCVKLGVNCSEFCGCHNCDNQKDINSTCDDKVEDSDDENTTEDIIE